MNPNPPLESLLRRNAVIIAKLEAAAGARTRGEYISDVFAEWIGSWTFVIGQGILLCVWMMINIVAWTQHWDPYPFVFLNLLLSFQSAIFGPIIMISQNRQSRLFERRIQLDLQISLLAEQKNTETLRLLRRLCEKAGVDSREFATLDRFTDDSQTDALIEEIERASKPPRPRRAR